MVELISELKRLPGIGPRSAERVAVWLLQHDRSNSLELAEVLCQAKQRVTSCPECGFFATDEGCPVCSDSGRDASLLCVVEQATDVLPMERASVFGGYYHCLGGKLSPLDHVTPDDLRIAPLLRRIDAQPGVEVILALGADVEGEATANYLAELLASKPCQVSRIAQGLPAGGGLDHADELTLMRAMQGRREM
ncbi:recombination mediator RecR [Oceaniferula marina]|uniref:recombination mediator RecR n=1 Tax=Oceaniferula marina TaxID=2748318 RepID=UPI0029CA62B2|nr:recombination mediator RecR [Oceaniferula marina]